MTEQEIVAMVELYADATKRILTRMTGGGYCRVDGWVISHQARNDTFEVVFRMQLFNDRPVRYSRAFAYDIDRYALESRISGMIENTSTYALMNLHVNNPDV